MAFERSRAGGVSGKAEGQGLDNTWGATIDRFLEAIGWTHEQLDITSLM